MGLEKNTAGKWVVFAYGGPDHASAGLYITGDASNITANIRIDGGAANAIDDTNPTELEDGFYVFDVTATETNGDLLLICPESASSDVIVIGAPAVVHTVAPNFNALGIESDGDLTKVNTLNGHTAQTGDTYTLANGSTGFVAIDTVVDSILVDTGTTLPATLSNIETKVDTVDTNVDAILVDTATTLPATLSNIETKVDTVDGVVDAILVDTGTTIPDRLTTIDGSLFIIDGIVDQLLVAAVVMDANIDSILVDTATTLPSTLTTIEGKVDTIDTVVDSILVDTGTTLPATLSSISSQIVTVDTVVDNINIMTTVIDNNVDSILIDTGTTLPATLTTIETKVDTVDGVVDAVLVDTATTLPATLSGIETKVDTVDGVVDAILVDTSTTLPAAIPSVSDIWTTAVSEAYRTTGATGSAAELLHEILAHLARHATVGTTKTLYELDGVTPAKTSTYDDATSPTSITEAT